MAGYLPEIIIHWFEKELVIWTIDNIFEVPQCYLVWWFWNFNKVRCLFVVNVVNNLRFFRSHFIGSPCTFPHFSLIIHNGRAQCKLAAFSTILIIFRFLSRKFMGRFIPIFLLSNLNIFSFLMLQKILQLANKTWWLLPPKP